MAMAKVLGMMCVVSALACTRDPLVRGKAVMGNAHAWAVFDGDVEILDVSDAPGAITSTAALPPGVKPAQHPFLSASARSAAHENRLRQVLEQSQSLAEFLGRLADAGFDVRAR